ncbi:MAG: hypothetical protein K5665_07810 [Saccharofermentans sp.]|nr:hypothetical protein [Saccharofermentans sp.]
MKNKQTIIIIACVAGILVVLIGIIIGVKALNKDRQLVSESSTSAAVSSDVSGVVSGDITDATTPGNMTDPGSGETTISGNSGETDATTAKSQDNAAGTTSSAEPTDDGGLPIVDVDDSPDQGANEFDPDSTTRDYSETEGSSATTAPEPAETSGTSAQDTDGNGVVELPFVPADDI